MTMTKEQLKAKVCEAIAARKGDIKNWQRISGQSRSWVIKRPAQRRKSKRHLILWESATVISWRSPVKARLKGGKGSKRSVAVIGELDAIICAEHPDADDQTGAAHCCGHNAQIANMMAVTMGLVDSGRWNIWRGRGALRRSGRGICGTRVPQQAYRTGQNQLYRR